MHADEAYCQPCVSPVWDTGLVCHALLEAGANHDRGRRASGLTGSCPCRCWTCAAIGLRSGPTLRPGGWAFQYANPHYPDVDDTAVVVMAMDRADNAPAGRLRAALARAREWVVGMQS